MHVPQSRTRARQLGELALRRDRLGAVVDRLFSARLCLVVAPAGCGKTTLLGQLVEVADATVVWYRADDVDAEGRAVLEVMEGAFRAAFPGVAGDWADAGDAVRAIRNAVDRPTLLVVDDLQSLEGTPSERLLERVVDNAPPSLTVLAASRIPPRWNLSRWRVAGELLELGVDDLRFRSWEVESLFRDVYGTPLPPDDLAALTRRTEGWAAGLQLFHLATRDKPAAERRRTLDALGPRLRIVREYLVRNVVEELPGELRRFLIDTCMLGRLQGGICDRFLGRTGSQGLLEELERRQLFTFSLGHGGWYRCHEVLRAHLEAVYVDHARELEATARYAEAGRLLEGAGAFSDALLAYCRAEDWDAVARLTGHRGPELSDQRLDWVDTLPPALLRLDPWLMLAEARRHRAAGRWAAAVTAYSDAEQAMADGADADRCREERSALTAMVDPTAVDLPGWLGMLRGALRNDPMAAYWRGGGSDDPRLRMVAGLAALAAGRVGLARPALRTVADDPDASPAVAAAARLALAAADALAELPVGPYDTTAALGAEAAAEELEKLGLGGLTRLALLLRSLVTDGAGGGPAAVVGAGPVLRTTCRRDGDRWGESVAGLLEGWARLSRPAGVGPDGDAAEGVEAADLLDRAADDLDRLGAPVLGALAASLAVLAQVRAHGASGETRARAMRAESRARTLGSPGAQAVATLALAEADLVHQAELRAQADVLAGFCGLVLPGPPPTMPAATPVAPGPVPAPSVPAPTPSPMAVTCFGGFSLVVGGRAFDMASVKPKARKALRLLALHAPDWVHRERLIQALWPDVDVATGARNLQVVVSSLRHALEPGTGRAESTLIVRQGEAYRLALPRDASIDRLDVDRAVTVARAALTAGDTDRARAALTRILDLAAAPLLPEDGPDEWVLPARDRYRAEVSRAAQDLARLHLTDGDARAAAAVAERGLVADRWCDGLWRLLVEASTAAGDVATATRARREYADVLAGLGLSGEASDLGRVG
ncbi:MAG: hypothetical protein QOG82_644 [Actinomycetota bacterium]|nr:hypothetical protein [Actinomycetota bacterium]